MPKTIDNDLNATDYTFGFDTAVNIAMEAIDRLHTTAESHHRTLVVEVMGRHAGWIALHAGLAGGANVILLPERQVRRRPGRGLRREALPDQLLADRRGRRGRPAARRPDGAANQELDAFGHVRLGGIGQWLAEQLEAKTGKEARTVVLGHIQRGGTPDRVRPGARHPARPAAIDAVHEGDWGKMVAMQGTDIVRVPLIEATGELKTVPLERYAEAEVFFG